MDGSMLPIGAASSPKGAMLALVVELLVTALIGANFGFEASSFFVAAGHRPRIGQSFIVIDPGALAGREQFLDRLEVLVRAGLAAVLEAAVRDVPRAAAVHGLLDLLPEPAP